MSSSPRTSLDDALAAMPPEPESARTMTPSKPRRHRHVWGNTLIMCRRCGAMADATGAGLRVALYHDHDEYRSTRCLICQVERDPAASRRGRNARRRGLDKQRQANRLLGITNLPGNAPNHDGGKHDELFASESKSGASFSERYWRWLTNIPTLAGQVPVLIVADAPGPGHRMRRMVIVRAEDWRDLHGKDES